MNCVLVCHYSIFISGVSWSLPGSGAGVKVCLEVGVELGYEGIGDLRWYIYNAGKAKPLGAGSVDNDGSQFQSPLEIRAACIKGLKALSRYYPDRVAKDTALDIEDVVAECIAMVPVLQDGQI